MWPQGIVTDPNAPEVRWCSKCHQNAVVLVHRWQHSLEGTFTSTQLDSVTRDYRCQHCGKKYRVRPRLHTTIGLIIGVMSAMSIIGLPIFFVYWRRHNVHKRIPRAAGAPMPEMRFFENGPPLRACAGCSTPATVQKITRKTHNGIPAGTEYLYRCTTCTRDFTIQSVGSIVGSVLSALFVAAGAAAFLAWAETPGWRWGGAGVCAVFTLLLVWQVVDETQKRRRHPVVGAPAR
jgi:DNA-directed RNA polymerase subunit RPC12/RpoP